MSRRPAPSSPLRRTASRLAREPGPEPAFGKYLWERTNQIVFGSPVVSCSGRFGNVVYQERGKKCFVRRYSAPRNPDQPRQLEQQDRMRLVMPSWSGLPAADRQGWLDYAIRHFGEHQPGKKRGNLGQNAYTSASLNRLARGETLQSAPPVHAPPRQVIQLVEVPAPAGQFAWRVEHGLSAPEGYLLEVEMTPEAPGNQKPLRKNLVRAGRTTAGSFFPLQRSGELYVLDQPRHAVNPGRRYGLQVRLVTPEGVEGRALFLELERKAPGELPPDSLVVESGGVELTTVIAAASPEAADSLRLGRSAAHESGDCPDETPFKAGKAPPDQDRSPPESYWFTATRESP